MKKLLLLTLLTISSSCLASLPTWAKNIQEKIFGVETKKESSNKKMSALFTAMVKAKSLEEGKKIGAAYYDLRDACTDNECKVTDETSKQILQKYGLVDDEGTVSAETNETLEYIKNNPISLRDMLQDLRRLGSKRIDE